MSPRTFPSSSAKVIRGSSIPPHFLRMPFWIGPQRRLCIDPPSADAIVGSRGTQMRVTWPILHPAEEKRVPVRKTRSSRVEHRMRRVGPVGGRQNRITPMAQKQHFVTDGSRHVVSCHASAAAAWLWGWLLGRPAARISHNAIRNESVASAPWLRLMPHTAIMSGRCNWVDARTRLPENAELRRFLTIPDPPREWRLALAAGAVVVLRCLDQRIGCVSAASRMR
jgi:hypothetical protein